MDQKFRSISVGLLDSGSLVRFNQDVDWSSGHPGGLTGTGGSASRLIQWLLAGGLSASLGVDWSWQEASVPRQEGLFLGQRGRWFSQQVRANRKPQCVLGPVVWSCKCYLEKTWPEFYSVMSVTLMSYWVNMVQWNTAFRQYLLSCTVVTIPSPKALL